MELGFINSNNSDEIRILYKVLKKLNINDIKLSYKNKKLFATDNDNVWLGKEFYDFIIHEAFVYEDNKVLGISDELYKEFVKLSKQY